MHSAETVRLSSLWILPGCIWFKPVRLCLFKVQTVKKTGGCFSLEVFWSFNPQKKSWENDFSANGCCWQVLTIHIACTNLGRCLKYLQTVQWLIMAHPVRNDGSLRAVDIWYMIKLKDIGYMIYDICMQYTYTKPRKIVDTRCGALFLVIYSIFRV